MSTRVCLAGATGWVGSALALAITQTEIIFGMPDQKLTILHDFGSSAQPYMDGTLLAIRRIGTLVGFHRGLDAVLDL